MRKQTDKHTPLFEKQKAALRDPLLVATGASPGLAGFTGASLKYQSEKRFTEILQKTGCSLLISREYEHFITTLRAQKGRIEQSYYPLPHPSGIALHPEGERFYVASTRNPNRIVEFCRVDSHLERKESPEAPASGYFFPSRTKLYAGATYLHDLAFIGKDLYANAVGFNGIFKVNLSEAAQEALTWWAPSTDINGSADMRGNYLQLNSIAAGDSPLSSFFTASTESPQHFHPGHKKFKVDQRGVVFEASTGNVIARGLTRPHSARFFQEKIWLCNSGYGEIGFIENEKFIPVAGLNGWTRGLCFIGDYAFTGISRVLPGFEHYAPGVNSRTAICGVAAVHTKTGKVEGMIEFPYGNQIFALEPGLKGKPIAFPFSKCLKKPMKKQVQMYYQFQF